MGSFIVTTFKSSHARQISTTSDIYAHVIKEADKKNADIPGDIFLRNA